MKSKESTPVTLDLAVHVLGQDFFFFEAPPTLSTTSGNDKSFTDNMAFECLHK